MCRTSSDVFTALPRARDDDTQPPEYMSSLSVASLSCSKFSSICSSVRACSAKWTDAVQWKTVSLLACVRRTATKVLRVQVLVQRAPLRILMRRRVGIKVPYYLMATQWAPPVLKEGICMQISGKTESSKHTHPRGVLR